MTDFPNDNIIRAIANCEGDGLTRLIAGRPELIQEIPLLAAKYRAESFPEEEVKAVMDDIPDAVAHVETMTIERMERAIIACQEWNHAGLLNTGLVVDMATAYLAIRKKRGE